MLGGGVTQSGSTGRISRVRRKVLCGQLVAKATIETSPLARHYSDKVAKNRLQDAGQKGQLSGSPEFPDKLRLLVQKRNVDYRNRAQTWERTRSCVRRENQESYANALDPQQRVRCLALPESQLRCKLAWHVVQRLIKFWPESSPPWLRNSLWWTSRLDIVPHDWHLQPSRRST
jgi:hypothetical protein